MDDTSDFEILDKPAPQLWKNVQFKKLGRIPSVIVETRLYSDSYFLSEYRNNDHISVLNGLPSRFQSRYEMSAALMLRLYSYIPRSYIRNGVKSQYTHYHGGSIYDEVAALISLILDVRVMSGKPEREFGYDDDPLGRPTFNGQRHGPTYNFNGQYEQIPRLRRDVDLSALLKLSDFEVLSAEDAIALMKAARLYQKALWVANDSPETAWLFLVSAAEAAAVRYGSRAAPPVLPPRILDLLNSAGATHLAQALAEELKVVSAPTSKFVGFLKRFSPSAPEPRPGYSKFNFSKKNIKKAVSKIYDHRSNVLHNGTAFPAPMCFAPHVFENGANAEIPDGLAVHTLDSSWSNSDTPMLLSTFSYIVRGALIAWWAELSA